MLFRSIEIQTRIIQCIAEICPSIEPERVNNTMIQIDKIQNNTINILLDKIANDWDRDLLINKFDRAYKQCKDDIDDFAFEGILLYINNKKSNIEQILENKDILKIEQLLENNKITKDQITEKIFNDIVKLCAYCNRYKAIKSLFNIMDN